MRHVITPDGSRALGRVLASIGVRNAGIGMAFPHVRLSRAQESGRDIYLALPYAYELVYYQNCLIHCSTCIVGKMTRCLPATYVFLCSLSITNIQRQLEMTISRCCRFKRVSRVGSALARWRVIKVSNLDSHVHCHSHSRSPRDPPLRWEA